MTRHPQLDNHQLQLWVSYKDSSTPFTFCKLANILKGSIWLLIMPLRKKGKHKRWADQKADRRKGKQKKR